MEKMILGNIDFENKIINIRERINKFNKEIQDLKREVDFSYLSFNKLEYDINNIEDYAEMKTENLINKRIIDVYQKLWYADIEFENILALLKYGIYFNKLYKLFYDLDERYLNRDISNNISFDRETKSVTINLSNDYYLSISVSSDIIFFEISNSNGRKLYYGNVSIIMNGKIKYHRYKSILNSSKEINEFEDLLNNNFELFSNNLFNIFEDVYTTGDVSELMNEFSPLIKNDSLSNEDLVNNTLALLTKLFGIK